jgi:hypothetical protein
LEHGDTKRSDPVPYGHYLAPGEHVGYSASSSWLLQELFLTNRRIVYQRGLLDHEVHSIPLRRVENVQTKESILGQLLGFGSAVVKGSWHACYVFDFVENPQAIQKTVFYFVHVSVNCWFGESVTGRRCRRPLLSGLYRP